MPLLNKLSSKVKNCKRLKSKNISNFCIINTKVGFLSQPSRLLLNLVRHTFSTVLVAPASWGYYILLKNRFNPYALRLTNSLKLAFGLELASQPSRLIPVW
nr:MAG TPA: hypothetical protein [Bacteriophage sp.]